MVISTAAWGYFIFTWIPDEGPRRAAGEKLL